MTYTDVLPGTFLERPNRFIALCEIEGTVERCHVKNTGRCRELLVPGASVYLQRAANPARSTRYDLISVWKGERLINMDSQAPNRVFREWAAGGGMGEIERILPERTFGNSRLDFYMEGASRRWFVEVKGVTLEEDGIAFFPDAPTERGVKHIRELCRCVDAGFEAMAAFIVQMEGARAFRPNDRTHPGFGDALREARARGVELLALDCRVTMDGIIAGNAVGIQL